MLLEAPWHSCGAGIHWVTTDLWYSGCSNIPTNLLIISGCGKRIELSVWSLRWFTIPDLSSSVSPKLILIHMRSSGEALWSSMLEDCGAGVTTNCVAVKFPTRWASSHIVLKGHTSALSLHFFPWRAWMSSTLNWWWSRVSMACEFSKLITKPRLSIRLSGLICFRKKGTWSWCLFYSENTRFYLAKPLT